MDGRIRLLARRGGVVALALVAASTLWMTTALAQMAASIGTRDDPQFGTVLTDPAGMTLYTFDRDANGTSNCSGNCAATWPPATVEGDVVAPDGLPGTLDSVARADGSQQLRYNNSPLYRYASDTQPGDSKGDGVGGVWHVAIATAG